MSPDTRVTVRGRLVCADAAQALAVEAHLPEHIRLTRAEPGCLAFDVTPVDPLTWDVAEAFADRGAFAAHQARVATSTWGQATEGIERRYVTTDASGE